MSIFISHADKDRAAYSSLCAAIDEAGLARWDPRDMKPGESLADQLRAGIDACQACIFIATPRSVKSLWCMAELGAFWGANKRVVIFVAEAVSQSELPRQFEHLLRTDDARKAISAVGKVIASASAKGAIEGRRLFEYEGYYPIDLAPKTNRPSLNPRIFARAIEFFIGDGIYDRLAAMDLVYLREDNRQHLGDPLPLEAGPAYEKLVDKYGLYAFRRDYAAETERLFRNTVRIVNDLGDTLRGVHFEVLLHDVRNPLRSIIAARNSQEVSGRRLFDPSTRFVVQYVKDQGQQLIEAMRSGSKVSYPKEFLSTKRVKATTTPLYDDRYGLIGILCLNVDIDAVSSLDDSGRSSFFKKYVETFGETPEFEREFAPAEEE